MDEEDENESHIRAALTSRKKTVDVPVPLVLNVQSYLRNVPAPFTRPPSHYVRARDCIVDGQAGREYDLDDDDFAWLEQHPGVAEDDLEGWIDTLEKSAPNYFDKLSPEKAANLLQISVAQATPIWRYWKEKRDKLKKPILVRLRPAPAYDDPSPYIAFRPRDPLKKKQQKKNDATAYQRMQGLLKQMEAAQAVVEIVRTRERLKRDRVRLLSEQADVRIEHAAILAQEELSDFDDIEPTPPPVIVHHTPQRRGRAPRQPTTQQVAAAVVDEEVDSSSESEREQRDEAEEIQALAIAQRPGMSWTMQTVKLPSSKQLSFRGRMRMGRGGRVFYDRIREDAPIPEPPTFFSTQHMRWTLPSLDDPPVLATATTTTASTTVTTTAPTLDDPMALDSDQVMTV
eukprot:TRINITY_DN14555_c0_g1_i1.p1 TRINITY_DN14555_c0_g1~~TRINITY_DN14555_c0_g1_i1.p1  ORF type:complete len:460 (+),score=80.83 TRINITY_DN14555_c0_g1_i1:181-1380(+)